MLELSLAMQLCKGRSVARTSGSYIASPSRFGRLRLRRWRADRLDIHVSHCVPYILLVLSATASLGCVDRVAASFCSDFDGFPGSDAADEVVYSSANITSSAACMALPSLRAANEALHSCLIAADEGSDRNEAVAHCTGNFVARVNRASFDGRVGDCHWLLRVRVELVLLQGSLASDAANSTLHRACVRAVCAAAEPSSGIDPELHCAVRSWMFTPTQTETSSASLSFVGPPPSSTAAPVPFDWTGAIAGARTEAQTMRLLFDAAVTENPPLDPLPSVAGSCPAWLEALRDVLTARPAVIAQLPLNLTIVNVSDVAAKVESEYDGFRSERTVDLWIALNDAHVTPAPPNRDDAVDAVAEARQRLLMLDALVQIRQVHIPCWPLPNTSSMPPSSTEEESDGDGSATSATADAEAPPPPPALPPTTTPATTVLPPSPQPPSTELPTLPPDATFPPGVAPLRFTLALRNSPVHPFSRVEFVHRLAAALGADAAAVDIVLLRLNFSATEDVVVELRFRGPSGGALQDALRAMGAAELGSLGIITMAPALDDDAAEQRQQHEGDDGLARSSHLVWVGGVSAIGAAVAGVLAFNHFSNKKRRRRQQQEQIEQELGLLRAPTMGASHSAISHI